MQKLSVSDEEQMSRKEYLKNKKRQEKNMNIILGKFTKKKIIVAVMIIMLMIYVGMQLYIYYRQHNRKYLADQDVENQKVYNIYYMSEGYTYNPESSLNSINSNSFEFNKIYTNLGFEDIRKYNEYILGIKDNILYSFNLNDHVITKITELEVKKYTVYNDEVYFIPTDSSGVIRKNLTTNETTNFEKSNVAEILVDDNYVFFCIESNNNKTLYRYNKDTSGELKLTDKENVSYIIGAENEIYFVNKSDEDRIYKVGKEGTVSKVSDDAKSVTDTGNMLNIDGNKYMFIRNNALYYVNTADENSLWKLDLETSENTKVIPQSIDILQNVEDTVFYKIKNQRGLFLQNLNTGFNSQISSRLITEFVIDK